MLSVRTSTDPKKGRWSDRGRRDLVAINPALYPRLVNIEVTLLLCYYGPSLEPNVLDGRCAKV